MLAIDLDLSPPEYDDYEQQLTRWLFENFVRLKELVNRASVQVQFTNIAASSLATKTIALPNGLTDECDFFCTLNGAVDSSLLRAAIVNSAGDRYDSHINDATVGSLALPASGQLKCAVYNAAGSAQDAVMNIQIFNRV